MSTPELLERVSTVEVELIELDETSDRQHTAENCEPNSLGQVIENFKLSFSYFNFSAYEYLHVKFMFSFKFLVIQVENQQPKSSANPSPGDWYDMGDITWNLYLSLGM